MSHYSINAKNRKLKKQILDFFSRLGFGTRKLPISGQIILVLTIILMLSAFLPWFELKTSTLSNTTEAINAFSRMMGFIGFGIWISGICVLFFLLSHKKKEQVRAYVPFRLSDTQAVVFVMSMVFVAIMHLLCMLPVLSPLGELTPKIGLSLSIASVIFILVCGYFLSHSMKKENIDARYLDHDFEPDLWEYKDIIQPSNDNKAKKDNMTLPI